MLLADFGTSYCKLLDTDTDAEPRILPTRELTKDFMADHKFNGLIIWGFLRDTHGGIKASKELCRFSDEVSFIQLHEAIQSRLKRIKLRQDV